MFDDAGRSSEINHHIDSLQLLRGESPTSGVLRGADYLHAVPTLASDFRYQRSRLSTAE
jgi:predicted Zn-dependent protease